MRSRTTRMCLLAIAVAGAAVSLPNPAGATSVGGFQPLTLTGPGHHVHASSTGESDVNACADNVSPGVAHCLSRVRTNAGVTPMVLGNLGAYDPAYLQSAYDAPSANGGTGKTVAIVDAYDDPTAEADLAAYRSHFGLPACTTANGCFQKVDQNGGTSYPAYNSGWAVEIALDLDMVSALCPNCHILLVEAASSYLSNLGLAENRAATMGADVISNSYGTSDQQDIGDFYDSYFDHPGIPITVSSGDSGYGPEYPASSPNVIAVGGTTLTQTTNNGTRSAVETAWSGAGSGCSVSESKPSWQGDASCANRTVSDVSAVADPSTPVWVYNTSSGSTWYTVGGTSAAAPLVAAFYALAGGTHSGNAKSLYDNPSGLNDITSGSNGSCGGVYLCTGSAGFDGPTGLGTPNGVTAFTETTPVPVNTAAPTISGSFVASGGSASSSNGSWTNTPTSYAYQWQRCDAGGANCSNVGTNSSSYTPTNADVGSSLRVAVTATNTGGASAPAISDPTAVVVVAFTPVNTSPPTITNSSSTNQVLYSSAGTWSGSEESSHAMQWQLCDGSGNNCTNVAAATGSSVGYDVSAVGLSFRLEYSKTNAGGTGVGYSAALVITAAAPTSTHAPVISGRAVEGRTLTAAPGTWIGTAPVTYAYQWRRCTGSSCVDISNANKTTYLVAAADVGHTITARVGATNGQGALDADSAPTTTVTKGIPLIFTGPVISGTVKNGHTLTTTDGTWRGTAPISVTGYQWYRCTSVGKSCGAIAGATRKTYVVSGSDKNHALRLRVYVKNPVGSGNALTAPTPAAT